METHNYSCGIIIFFFLLYFISSTLSFFFLFPLNFIYEIDQDQIKGTYFNAYKVLKHDGNRLA